MKDVEDHKKVFSIGHLIEKKHLITRFDNKSSNS